ncbi:MAG TPA: hypothetical protein ENJ00_11315 [Phycisphaerales bacterium]|nr:hypothetical protein [Phycisphaerales bacterium]
MASAPETSTDRAVCVLWCAGEVPTELLFSLESRGVGVTICHGAFETMAEICDIGSIGGAPGGGAILVLVEPAQLRGKRALLTSCKRYAPWLRLWVYQHQAPIKLRPLELSQLGLDDPPAPATRPAGSAPIPRLKLTDEPRLQSEPGRADNQIENDGPPGRLLTDDELGMLLADESELDGD